VAVDVVIGLVAVLGLADAVGEPAEAVEVVGAEEADAVVVAEALAAVELLADLVEEGVGEAAGSKGPPGGGLRWTGLDLSEVAMAPNLPDARRGVKAKVGCGDAGAGWRGFRGGGVQGDRTERTMCGWVRTGRDFPSGTLRTQAPGGPR
jgi:hypothetical protein